MSARLLGTGLGLFLALIAACGSDGDSGSPTATSGGEAGTTGTTSGGRGGSGGSTTATGGVVSTGGAVTTSGGGTGQSGGVDSGGTGTATGGNASGTGGSDGGGAGASAGGEAGSSGGASSGAAGDGGTSQGGSGGDAGAAGGFVSCQPPERERCTSADPSCPTNQFCQFPGDPTPGCPGGSDGCSGDKTCASDGDCTGGVCTESIAACCSDDTTTTYCLAPCTDRSCGGFECMPSGHCECTDDACPLNQDCLSLSGAPRRCVVRECNQASDCDCGVCADGFCQPSPDDGYCTLPTP